MSKYLYEMLESIVVHLLEKEQGVETTKIISESYQK